MKIYRGITLIRIVNDYGLFVISFLLHNASHILIERDDYATPGLYYDKHLEIRKNAEVFNVACG